MTSKANTWKLNMANGERNHDNPPYSRVFVVCGKSLQEENLREQFEQFGAVEDLYMPRDRDTGDSKGVAYIKYSKTSSAAAAIEELHMKTIKNYNKPIKVLVASSKNDGHRDDDEKKYKRLFIKVHKEATESEVRQHFSTFGRVDSVHLQRDKVTDAIKGFAYVNYANFRGAATAFEQCDRKYKPIFATPVEELKRSRNSLEGTGMNYGDNQFDRSYRPSFGTHKEELKRSRNSIEDLGINYVDNYYAGKDNSMYMDHFSYGTGMKNKDSMTSLIKTAPMNYDTVSVTCSPQVPQKCIERLFNIIPGMKQCQYTDDSYNGFCKAVVTYDCEKAAAFAVERLNNFEFPSGEIVSVRPQDNALNKVADNLTNLVNSFKNSIDNGNPDLLQLADAIAQASTLIKAATSGRSEPKVDTLDINCSVSLPAKKPMASSNSKVAQRCFIVCKPQPPPMSVLQDAFCRFGDLIDVSIIPNKNFGFAKYATISAAQEAINILNDAILCGIKVKVVKADERSNKDDKMNVDDENVKDHNVRGSDYDKDSKRMKLSDLNSEEWILNP